MALPNQLKTARMTNATLGVDIDNRVGDLEIALCDILGITIDSNVTESHFNLDNSGRITKALIRQIAVGPVGWRFKDSVGTEYSIQSNANTLRICKNSGTEGSPVWTNIASIDVNGVWTFTGIPVGPASDPTTANQLTRKSFVDAAIAAVAATKVSMTGNETVAGIKTFSSFPVTPSSAPATNYQVANKKFVDDSIAAAAVPAEARAKAWVKFATDGSILDSYNVSGVVRNALGTWTISFTTPFASANYAVSICGHNTAFANMFPMGVHVDANAQQAGSLKVAACDHTGGYWDIAQVYVICFGDQ